MLGVFVCLFFRICLEILESCNILICLSVLSILRVLCAFQKKKKIGKKSTKLISTFFSIIIFNVPINEWDVLWCPDLGMDLLLVTRDTWDEIHLPYENSCERKNHYSIV